MWLKRFGMEALEEKEEDSKKEAEEEGEENMMDETGKHFSANGCKNKLRVFAALGQPQHWGTGKQSIMPDTWLPPE